MRNRPNACLVVDWSARREPAPVRESADAIWLCLRTSKGKVIEYCRTRLEAEAIVRELLLATAGRIIAGFDFSFAYPAWAMERLGGWEELWSWLEAQSPRLEVNRFQVAAEINDALGAAYLWGAPTGETAVPQKKVSHEMPEYRECELRMKPRPQSSFKLFTAGSVGSQMLLGIPVLERLRACFGPELGIWPFEDCARRRITVAEVWPSILGKAPDGEIADRWQAETLSARLMEKEINWDAPHPLAAVEGWILGLQ